MSDHNKLLVRRYFTEVLNKGKYELIKELFSPSFIFSGPSLAKPVPGMPDGLYDFVANIRHAFPDLYVSVENEIAEENQVVVIWRMTGTQEHPFRGVPPAHTLGSITGMDIFTIENGRIEGMWAFFDMRSVLEQMTVRTRKPSRTAGTTKRRTPAASKKRTSKH
ncbi:MAG: ester cyclase [Bacteroidetes bacterium]|nr:ester cyclase [Bacteroidota bacterium]